MCTKVPSRGGTLREIVQGVTPEAIDRAAQKTVKYRAPGQ